MSHYCGENRKNGVRVSQYPRFHSRPIQGWFSFAGLSTAICAVCLGCGGDGFDISLASGVVQRNGTPLSGGKVLFSPLDSQKSAIGLVQPDGTFVLSTLSDGDGAMPGRYRVGIVSEFEFRGRKSKVSCRAPKKILLTVESNQENDFVINVSEADGWNVVEDN